MSGKKSLVVGLSLLVFSFFAVSQSSSAFAAWLLDSSGTLVQVDSSVLGEEDSREDSSEAEKRALELRQEREKKALEIRTEARKKTLELNRQVRKSEIELKDNKLQIRQELKNQEGKVINRSETKLPENEPLRVEREDGQELEIKAAQDQRLELKGEKVRTRTNFPLTIGENNALIVTKKDGTEKTVTYLPDAAVANLEQKGFITTSTDTSLEESVDGTPVYKFETQQEKKLLGLFKRRFKKSVEVSAETGEVVRETSTEPTALARFLERLAF